MTIKKYRIDVMTPARELPALLTQVEAAMWLRCSTRTLLRWETAGKLNVVRPAEGAPLIKREEVLRLIDG